MAMYRSVHSTGDCDAFQQDLDSIAVWCSKWQMRLNVSKCDLLYVSNKRTPTKPSYHINYNLHWVSYVKYLGVSWIANCHGTIMLRMFLLKLLNF